MLTIKHYVAPSSIAGVGLFCAEEIKKGQVIFKYDYRFVFLISDSEIESLPEGMKDAVLKYSYRGIGKDRLTRAVYYCIDDSRFMNHSDSPNTIWMAGDDTYVAACNIKRDMELTCNYSDFCEAGEYCFSFN